jgi:hypothetical protein
MVHLEKTFELNFKLNYSMHKKLVDYLIFADFYDQLVVSIATLKKSHSDLTNGRYGLKLQYYVQTYVKAFQISTSCPYISFAIIAYFCKLYVRSCFIVLNVYGNKQEKKIPKFLQLSVQCVSPTEHLQVLKLNENLNSKFDTLSQKNLLIFYDVGYKILVSKLNYSGLYTDTCSPSIYMKGSS